MNEPAENALLTRLLEEAADERPGAAAAFFELLLRSELYVAVLEQSSADAPRVPQLGHLRAGEHGFVVVPYEGKECLLVFTEAAFIEDWAGAELPMEKKEFKALLWLVGDDSWIYINPNQEVGKELTSWEIEQLRRGPDAIPELVAALGEHGQPEFEVRTGPDLFPELKRKLLPVLELSRELEEAFLVAVLEEEGSIEKPLIGLRFGPVDAAVKQYIRTEIQETAQELTSIGDRFGHIIIVDDLDNDASPNHGLFADAKPFYFGTQTKRNTGVKNALMSFFGFAGPQSTPDKPSEEEE